MDATTSAAATASKSESGAKSESGSAMTPQEYLAAAEAALASDQPLEFSRLMWLAAEAAFIRLAQVHKMEGADLHELARTLDEREGCAMYYRGKLGTATGLRLNVEIDFLEPYELELSHESICRFIKDTV